MTNAENEATSYAYDLAGNLATVTDPLTRVTSYGYDTVNRRNSTTVPSGDSGTTLFDTAGQVESSTSPAGYVATYTYDARGLIESITDELGNSQASVYDGAGRLVTATDGRGNDTTFGYDPNGRLETETDPLGGSVTFGYDLAGQRTSVTDPNGAIRTFGFDDGGRLTTAVDAENRTTSYSYDAVSRRTEMTDARGVTVTSTFDDAGQLTDRVSPNETQSFSYDDAGRRTAWSDASGATAVAFDDVGRMTGITTPAGVVAYGFNDAGEQETMTQPEGVVAYGYDVNGFMDSVSDWRSESFVMVNDADGRMLTAARSNGVDTDYGYDVAGRLTSVGHNNGAAVIDSFAYDLGGNGNRTSVTSNAGAETYTLDALNRLTAVSYPGAVSEVFVYDDAGNRTSHTKTDGTTVGYTVDDTGQLISDTTGTTYTYDLAGNLTGTSAGDSYSYDDYSRTTSVTAGATTQTYGYDAAGVRVTVDGIGQLWDRNGLPTLISTGAGDSYVHAAGVARDGDDWLLADAVGSVRATVDNTGATIGTADYSVFGEQLSGAGTFGFAGEQQDPTGLIHLRARQYDPTAGRFTSVDPVQPGAPGTTGYNLYAYSGNNPTTWIDPTGRGVLAEYGALVGDQADATEVFASSVGNCVNASLYRTTAGLRGYQLSDNPSAAVMRDCAKGAGSAAIQGIGYSVGGRALGEGLETIGKSVGDVRNGSRALPAGPPPPKALGPGSLDNTTPPRFKVDPNGTATDLAAPNGTPRPNLPFGDDALRSQVDDVVRHFDDFGTPPPGVAQGGLRKYPPGTYGNRGKPGRPSSKLPEQPLGYYTEMDVWTSQGVGSGTRGSERLVFGNGGEVWLTPTHYDDFVRIR